MAIFLVYSTSSITPGKKSLSRAQNSGHFENFEILINKQLQFDLRDEKILPNYVKKAFL